MLKPFLTMQCVVSVCVVSLVTASNLLARSPQAGDTGWTAYGGDGGGMRYSGAKQIDRGNVGGNRGRKSGTDGTFSPWPGEAIRHSIG
jgi:hypothetical protein